MGDMLIKMNGTDETKRVQCPWVSEEEVQRVTDFLRAQGEPVYDDNILKPRDDEEAAADEADAEQDPLYDDAVRLVADTQPLLDLVAPAQAGPRLQPRRAHRRDDGAARAWSGRPTAPRIARS